LFGVNVEKSYVCIKQSGKPIKTDKMKYRVYTLDSDTNETSTKFNSLKSAKEEMKRLFNRQLNGWGYLRIFLFKFDIELDGEMQINTKTTVNV